MNNDGEMFDEESRGPTSFNCYYGGNFKKTNDGEIYYCGGDFRFIEANPRELFTEFMKQLPVTMYRQKVFYKLPFEEQKERKLMMNGDANFKKMCNSAFWIKAIDIFIESERDEETESDESDEEEQTEKSYEEAVRVEKNVANFVDEEEADEYESPIGSDDDDDDDDDREGYVRYVRESGELKLRQVFDSLEDFKKAIVDYVLKEGWNVQYVRYGKEKSELKCASNGESPCSWRIYCSYEEPAGKWMVKVYYDEHSCSKTGYSKILTGDVIASLFVDDLRNDRTLMPKKIQYSIQQRWDLIASIDKCRKAKARAFEMLQKEHDEQFSRLNDYRLEMMDSNPESSVLLETVPSDAGRDKFYRFYVCFDALRNSWKNHCRSIFGLDGCFLKSTTRGQLLAAVGRDANNQMYPIAWVVVDIESEINWVWFIGQLRTDLGLGDGDGLTIISDRQKGLLNAVAQILPKVEHRMCARHIYGNLKKAHPHRADMKGLFWRVAKSYTMADYNLNVEAMKTYDLGVYESMMSKNPKNCSLAFFHPTSTCDDVSNNISEAYNNAIDPTRLMPLVEMLETIRRQAMIRIEQRKDKAIKHKSRFTLKAMAAVQLEHKEIKHCRVYPGGDGAYEVTKKNKAFKVYLTRKSCTCRKWDMSGIPCRHVLKIISDKQLNQEDYISHHFLTSKWLQQYSFHIKPANGINFWERSGENELEPPPHLVRQGRKPIPKRKKGKNESPTKKNRVSRERRIVTCGNCGYQGHNTRKCPNPGVPVYRPPKKKSKGKEKEGSDIYTFDHGEGPSQQTQD